MIRQRLIMISLLFTCALTSACQSYDPFAYAHYRVQQKQLKDEIQTLKRQLMRYPSDEMRSSCRTLERELSILERKMRAMRDA
ncbi:MAG: hypothetical protein VYD19_08790 [Myxococcota bacterium]|nr:hypothetical protein [Myxococcota bacterium]